MNEERDPGFAAEGIRRHDVDAVNSAEARRLYKSRAQIYPKLVHGRWRMIKWAVMIVTLAIYYGVPWIRWDRGPNAPDQAVLVDFAHRRFYFFWIEIWPQEIYYITGLLILSAVGLFLVTALFGRVWCGYTCPQTVWTDLFIVVERFFEGDRNARIRLDRSPLSLGKLWRKSAKHIVWLLIGAATGGAWIFYYHDAPSLVRDIPAGTAPFTAYFFLGLMTFTTYIFAGTMREQVCTYMCPWPRIQAAMIDKESLAITYRTDRGEPRGAHKKGEPWEGRGDCIDCKQCVVACPMGIDIRDGLQLECIQCALCIDACDEIMGKVGRPRALIAYDTDLNIARRQAGERVRFRLVRLRTLFYVTILVVVGALMTYGLLTRDFLEFSVLRDRNPLYVMESDGSVQNGFTLKILNMRREERRYRVTIEGLDRPLIKLIGDRGTYEALPPVTVGPDRTRSLRLLLTVPAGRLPSDLRTPLRFTIRDEDLGTAETAESVFVRGRE